LVLVYSLAADHRSRDRLRLEDWGRLMKPYPVPDLRVFFVFYVVFTLVLLWR
jgi:hypothetical protein